MRSCEWCPRRCGADRSMGERGFCGQGGEIRIARAALHPYEEPCISGTRGSGTVFFVGCTLGCVYCQNREISRSVKSGRAVSSAELGEILLSLQAEGAHNVNLVTPTHFTEGILEALEAVKSRLRIPVVWNTSGYERVETLRRLEGLVEIYMPDWKYASSELAADYSAAPDYPETVRAAIREMVRQTGAPRMGEDGLLRSGVMVRHLVLPAHREDSIAVLRALSETVAPSEILLSLMSQYTPEFSMDSPHKNLHRRLTTFEYQSVMREAERLGFEGYMQARTSAKTDYTPDFE